MGTVARVLAENVSLRITSADRIGIGAYIPALVHEGGLVAFLLNRARLRTPAGTIPSPALLDANHRRMIADFEDFLARSGVPVVRFRKGQVKEDIARPFQLAAAAEGRAGVVLVGKAQERTEAWAGYKDPTNPHSTPRHPHFVFSRQSRVPDHWYFYGWDDNWGPFFIKLCPYAPYPSWIGANGHEWAKAQLAKAGVGFSALDNGLWRVDDPGVAHRITARLGAGHLQGLIGRWLPTLPSPLIPADRARGIDWAFSVRQLEISDTAVFDRPAAGRALFEAAIRDHLDLGRPDRIRIVFDRQVVTRGPRPTPGRFSTEVITRGVSPTIQIHYRSSKAKAYFKEGRALRVETTFNNANDVGVKKTLNADNWRALRRAGSAINARFAAALGEGEAGLPDASVLEDIVFPSHHGTQRAPGLRLGDPRVTALFGALSSFSTCWEGLTNRALRETMSGLLDAEYSSAQATYDLRRLRLKGLIERIPGSQRYQVTAYGRRVATFFTRLVVRVVTPTLTELDALSRPTRRAPRPLAAAWRSYDRELTTLLKRSGLAA